MRLRDAIAVAVIAAVGLGACSRLTFIKPSTKRKGFTQTGPDYTIRSDGRGNARMAALDRVALAEQRLRAGQVDQAEVEARAALKVDPKLPDAYTVLAMVADRRGQGPQAGGYYAKAAQLAPARGTVLNNYGVWLCGNGRAAESLGWFDRALADPAYPTRARALANAGACALDAGQYPRAERDLRQALSLDPANPAALGAMARNEYRAARYLEARAFSERRLAAAAATPETLVLASQIEEKLGDTAAAARYVRRLREEFPQTLETRPGEASRR